jgi:hypothetical protein
VQRVEAQIRREPLRQLGVVTAEHAIANAGAVYLYAVTKWLRLVVPGSASRRERATEDARWVVVQGTNVAAGAQAAARVMPDRHAPALDAMIPTLAGYAVNAGEALGIHDLDTVWRQLGLLVGGLLEDRCRDFAAEVKARRLDFGPSAA